MSGHPDGPGDIGRPGIREAYDIEGCLDGGVATRSFLLVIVVLDL